MPGRACTFWEDGGTGITQLRMKRETCLNFSNRERKEENIHARKKDGIIRKMCVCFIRWCLTAFKFFFIPNDLSMTFFKE